MSAHWRFKRRWPRRVGGLQRGEVDAGAGDRGGQRRVGGSRSDTPRSMMLVAVRGCRKRRRGAGPRAAGLGGVAGHEVRALSDLRLEVVVDGDPGPHRSRRRGR
jgi:hypothetical protein